MSGHEKSRVEVLVATMNRTDLSLPEKLNLQTDAIIGNQCDRNEITESIENGHRFRWYSLAERGVGLNRNTALLRAEGEFLLFADDDMVYSDGYEKIVCDAFDANPRADVILFNLEEPTPTRFVITKKMKIGRLNYLRFGTARIAVRRDSVRRAGIAFHQCFGGGTEHCHGEDNLFLTDCLNRGLKIVALPITLAKLTEERPSTWNDGYGEKYLLDQGALYRAVSRRHWRLLCLQDAVRHRKDYKTGIARAYRKMKAGAKAQGK